MGAFLTVDQVPSLHLWTVEVATRSPPFNLLHGRLIAVARAARSGVVHRDSGASEGCCKRITRRGLPTICLRAFRRPKKRLPKFLRNRFSLGLSSVAGTG